MVIGVAQYRTIKSLVESSFWVAHSNQVLATVEAMVSATKDAETDDRAYALTGQSRYLESLKKAVSTSYSEEQALKTLTRDNPRQQHRLQVLDGVLTRRFALLTELVKVRDDRGIEAAAQFGAAAEADELAAAISAIGDELKDEEYLLLKVRAQAVEDRTKRALAVVLFGTLTALALVAAAGLMIRTLIKRWQHLERVLGHEKHLLSTLLDNIPDSVYFKDTASRFTRINKAMARWLNVSDPAHAAGKADADFFSDEHAQEARRDELEIMRSGRPIIAKEERERWLDRPETWVTTSKLPLHDAHGHLVGTFGISRDITVRKRSEEALEEANSKLTGWVGELESRNRESVLLTEMGELLQTSINEEEAQNIIRNFASRLFQHRSGALCIIKASRNSAETVAAWGEIASSEELFNPHQCWALRRGRLHHAGRAELRINCAHIRSGFDGDYLCVPMVAQGEALGILHLSSESLDHDFTEFEQRLAGLVAERIGVALANLKLREALRAQSIRDPLTGLFNRRYMEESLDRELRRAERNHKSVGVIMIDLDHFKSFNDTFGHDAGDLVLREFGNLLRARTRKEDIACRYGGEEFILVLPEATLEDTYRRAEELREATKHLDIHFEAKSLGAVTSSMGVAVFPEHSAGAIDLVRAADTALYQAKTSGRDRVVLAASAYALA